MTDEVEYWATAQLKKMSDENVPEDVRKSAHRQAMFDIITLLVLRLTKSSTEPEEVAVWLEELADIARKEANDDTAVEREEAN